MAEDVSRELPRRRWLLTAGAGAAAAGIGAVLATPESASAASGSAVQQGGTFAINDAGSAETDLTSTASSYTLNVHNTSTTTTSGQGTAIGAYTTANAAAIAGVNGGPSGSSGPGGPGVSGASTNGYGVMGSSTNTYAVYGIAPGTYGAVFGESTNSSGYGVVGQGDTGVWGDGGSVGVLGGSGTGIGVEGNSSAGVGVWGWSDDTYGVAASGSNAADLVAGGFGTGARPGRILVRPFPTPGIPAGAGFESGEQIRDVNGQMWLCINASTWQKVAAVAPGANGGSTNMLASPFRLYDSRPLNDSAITTPSGPIQSGAAGAIPLQVTGTAPKGGTAAQGVPAGAIGIVGTITVTNTTGAGYIVMFPTGGATPGTSNVNMTAAGQTVAASYVAALSSGGSVTVQCAGNSTDVIVDITGYIY